MAAEVSSEETGSVTAGTGVVVGGGGPETAPFPYCPKPSRVRVNDLGQGPAPAAVRQHSNTSPDSLPDMVYPGGDVTGPALSTGGGQSGFQGTNSGTVGVMCYSPTSEGPTSQISPTSTGPDDPSVFPPLPPPPAASLGCGGPGGTQEDTEVPDWPEQDDDDMEFPLSAPPSNQ